MRTCKCAIFALILAACGGRAAQPAPAAPAPRAASTEEAFRWRGRISPAGEVDVHVVHGSVRAEAAGGDQVEIDAKNGACTLRVHPDEQRVRVTAAAGEVELVVRVPAGVRLVVHAVNAPVRVSGIREVDARVVNGGIEIAHASRVRARSVNGAIHASLEIEGESTLSTVNGDIAVSLPAGSDVDVDARSTTGQIDLGVPVSGAVGAKSVHGVIGHGGHALRLKSVSGKISVGTRR
jgi:DUF4097 and DUF4098 domain-containing protein YvlB